MMKKILVFIIVSLIPVMILAQSESYDIFTITSQPGWSRSEFKDNIQFTLQKDNAWAVVTFYRSTRTTGSVESDFQADWNDLVGKNCTISSEISASQNSAGGWQMITGAATGTMQGQTVAVILITFSGTTSRSTILMTSNDPGNKLGTDIAAFMGEMSVKKADEVPPLEISQGQPAISNGTFPTPGEQPVIESTMMQEGWFVEATADYMQYTRNDIKVIQYFISENPTKDQFWDETLNRFFATDHYTAYEDNRITSFATIEFASCMATYRPTGQQYFIAWLIDWVNDAAFLAITATEPTYLQYFPDPKKLGEMLQFNNFQVSPQAIQGVWTNDDGAAAQMYNVNTGNYAGMAVAQASRKYTFSGNEYHFSAQGSTGMVGSEQVFQSEEKGTFQVNGYEMTVDITTPKPERVEYWVAFKYAKNMKTLWIQNKNASGLTFTLVQMQ
jgi:hypothetical protein